MAGVRSHDLEVMEFTNRDRSRTVFGSVESDEAGAGGTVAGFTGVLPVAVGFCILVAVLRSGGPDRKDLCLAHFPSGAKVGKVVVLVSFSTL